MQKVNSILLVIGLTFCQVLSFPPALVSAEEKAVSTSVRNTEQQEKFTSDYFRYAANGIFYLPRHLTNLVLLGGEKTTATLSDPDFIEKVEDILYLYKRELAWFPIAFYSPSYKFYYGGGIYYSNPRLQTLARVALNDSDYWSLNYKTTYNVYMKNMRLESSFLFLWEKSDDMRYYGLGPDPKKDDRNKFISHSDQDYGTFTEKRRKLQWSTALHPAENWGFRYLGYYQRRSFEDSGDEENLRDVFDVSTIPGFSRGAPVSQIYNELSVFIDTRSKKKIISPGWRSEIYGGISSGLGNNKTNLVRSGLDAAAFIPVVRKDRIITPRVVLDWTDAINDQPIPFTEYPRQQTFRGTYDHELIRSDKVSVVPSIEYQWPLSHMLSAHLFFDYLAVGPSLGQIGWEDGLWAGGFGINFHYFDNEFGKIEFAAGTEGLLMTLSFGTPIHKNSRSEW